MIHLNQRGSLAGVTNTAPVETQKVVHHRPLESYSTANRPSRSCDARLEAGGPASLFWIVILGGVSAVGRL